jgi:endonuclease/exonuclease/phosphatase (EEP) superfamily protein YafD
MTEKDVDPGRAGSSRCRDVGSRRILRRLSTLALVAALVQPASALLARWAWLPDVLSHFQGPAFVVTIAATVACALARRRAAIALAALVVLQVGPLLRYDGANPVAADAAGPRLRLLVANVQADNGNFNLLRDLIRRERPDVVGLIEYSEAWQGADLRDRSEYPHAIEVGFGTRGMALWFRRRPLAIEPPMVLVPDGNPVLRATIDFAGSGRQLWLVHPPNPIHPQGRRFGGQELRELTRRLAATPGPKVVAGDMNRTDGSPRFGDFLAATGLRDSRLGFGRQASWPAWSPYRIAIDHAFVTPDLAVVDRRLGPNIGSDHFPVLLDVAPAASSATNAATQGSQSSR